MKVNKLFLIISLSFVLLSSLALAANSPPAPEHFAYGLKLEVSGANAFYEIELPLDVYQNITRDDLGDMRVFNSAGNVVPHALRKSTRKITKKDAVTTTLPFFPITSQANSKLNDISIHVNKNADGTIIDVSTTDKGEQEKAIVSYLIDATALKGKKIYALELLWEDSQEDFMARIDVQSSQDLNSWKNSATATIARLNYQGDYLDRRKIETHNISAPYLRLTWPNDQPPIKLVAVEVLTKKTRTMYTPKRNLLSHEASPVADKPGDYRIDLQGPLPVDTVKIILQEENSLANAAIYSSKTADNSNSRRQWQGMIYNINYQGTMVSTPSIAIGNRKDRYWTIKIDKSENGINLPPVIEFSWQPDRLVFLAQGEAPFKLAYGSVGLESSNFQVASLLDRYRSVSGSNFTPKLISAGPRVILGGPTCLQTSIPLLPWRKYILWAILCGGVTMIGWMSISLYQQLQKAEK